MFIFSFIYIINKYLEQLEYREEHLDLDLDDLERDREYLDPELKVDLVFERERERDDQLLLELTELRRWLILR